jgi:hypothetical protein
VWKWAWKMVRRFEGRGGWEEEEDEAMAAAEAAEAAIVGP